MHLTIRIKMFLILVATSVAIIAGMLFLTVSSFEVGFIGFEGEVEGKRMNALADRLGQLHERDGGFQALEKSEMLTAALESLLWEPDPMLEEDLEAEIESGAFLEMEFEPIFFILDMEKKPLFGLYEPALKSRMVPLKAGGRQVGWLGVHEEDIGHVDEGGAFIEAQTESFWWIAAVMAVIAAIAAMGAAHHFQGPIRVLADGTRSLASGNYRVRIPVRSRDELGKLTEDFNTLAETLEKNEAARRKWVEDITHELKTPLTLMGGEIEAVRDGVRELTPETLELLAADLSRLDTLVDDLKALWQSEACELGMAREPVPLESVLSLSVERFREEFAAKGIVLEEDLDAHAVVSGDKERLGQVFDNILVNSLRYTRSPGEVRVGMILRDTSVVVDIQDTAPGVSEAEMEKIFQRLYRVEPSRNRALGGAGIGLAVCRNIVVAHGGTILAGGSPFGGLRITLELPLAEV